MDSVSSRQFREFRDFSAKSLALSVYNVMHLHQPSRNFIFYILITPSCVVAKGPLWKYDYGLLVRLLVLITV